MIQPQNSRGVIGEQHGLQRLTTALETLEAGQRAQQTRDTQIQAQLATQATALAQMGQWIRWQGWGLGALLVIVMALSGLMSWQLWHPPSMAYVMAFGAMDSTLTQQWTTLPKPTQDALTAIYTQLGVASPGSRQPAKK